MNTPHPYDLVIGLDRSDRKADLCLIDTHTGQRCSQTIDTAPEALWEWLLQLRQEHPQARVALCLEQPAVHLIALPRPALRGRIATQWQRLGEPL